MTRDEIIHQRRVRVLEHAAETGNVSFTCRTFGIFRKAFYEWRNAAERYGLEALMPKARRRPQLPNATRTHVLHDLLAIAVAEPTLGCRRLADRLADRGYVVSKTTVQKLLVSHGLGRRHQRVARAAALAALVTGAGRGAGARRLPAHRHRHRHPMGDDPDRAGPRHRRPRLPLHRPGAAPLAPHGLAGAGAWSAQRPGIPPRLPPAPRRPRPAPPGPSPPAARTTTPSASASTAPPSRSAGGRRSTGAASAASASSRPRPTPGCTATTPAGATTATSCAAAPPRQVLDQHNAGRAA